MIRKFFLTSSFSQENSWLIYELPINLSWSRFRLLNSFFFSNVKTVKDLTLQHSLSCRGSRDVPWIPLQSHSDSLLFDLLVSESARKPFGNFYGRKIDSSCSHPKVYLLTRQKLVEQSFVSVRTRRFYFSSHRRSELLVSFFFEPLVWEGGGEFSELEL